jgi:hypothetical protein
LSKSSGSVAQLTNTNTEASQMTVVENLFLIIAPYRYMGLGAWHRRKAEYQIAAAGIPALLAIGDQIRQGEHNKPVSI